MSVCVCTQVVYSLQIESFPFVFLETMLKAQTVVVD